MRNDSSLRPGILYSHTYTNGRLQSTSSKRNIHFTSGDFNDTISPKYEWQTVHINTTIEPQRTARVSISSQTPLNNLTSKPENTITPSTNVLRSHELRTLHAKLSPHSTLQPHTQNKNAFFNQKILNFFGTPSKFFYTANTNFLTHGYTLASHTPSILTKFYQTQSSAIHSRGSSTNKTCIPHFSKATNSANSFSASYKFFQTFFTYHFSISAFRSFLAT